MSELSNREWAAKILQGLKENSRRFAKTEKAMNAPKRQVAPSRRTPRATKGRTR